MQCDARRTPTGWALLALFAVLVVFYGYCLKAILSPPQDEEYRRTFLTGEFGAYPSSAVFKGRNGLDYIPGSKLDFTRAPPRQKLGRFDWIWRGDAGPVMLGLTGKVFLHIEASYRRPPKAYQLNIAFHCAMPDDLAGNVRILVNGTDVGGFTCREKPADFVFSADLPVGMVGTKTYDEIAIMRQPKGFSDRILTRLGQRLKALQMPWLQLKPVMPPAS